ncbi:hypothetical protein HMPREF9554_00257 [Treponema phagedenis F0421]|nr:hypothetical protein HMPREF9554_00257 [Treponema phagedenis F0421]
MLKSAVPHCYYSDLYNRKLITKRCTVFVVPAGDGKADFP